MSISLLRATIYLLAHGLFYDACGPNMSVTNERSSLRAFACTRNFRNRAGIRVSKSALKMGKSCHIVLDVDTVIRKRVAHRRPRLPSVCM